MTWDWMAACSQLASLHMASRMAPGHRACRNSAKQSRRKLSAAGAIWIAGVQVVGESHLRHYLPSVAEKREVVIKTLLDTQTRGTHSLD